MLQQLQPLKKNKSNLIPLPKLRELLNFNLKIKKDKNNNRKLN